MYKVKARPRRGHIGAMLQSGRVIGFEWEEAETLTLFDLANPLLEAYEVKEGEESSEPLEEAEETEEPESTEEPTETEGEQEPPTEAEESGAVSDEVVETPKPEKPKSGKGKGK